MVKLFRCLLCLFVFFAVAELPAAAPRTVVYFFWAEGCPHCAEAHPVLERLTAGAFELRSLEVTRHRENARAYLSFAERFGFKARSVPAVFVGNRYWIGYNAEIGEDIARYLEQCRVSTCTDAALFSAAKDVAGKTVEHATTAFLDVPLIGRVNLQQGSLWANTAIIAFADGFNPCSLWVLSMLLALIIHTGSRGKVFLIGFVFLTVTSLVYVAFIAGIFSVMQLIGFIGAVRVIMALLSLAMGIINIKDFFWYKRGISLTIAEESKPSIFARMRNVLANANAFWPLIVATVLLAGGVSLAEFSCTAGFPVLWVNLISAGQVSSADFILLLAFYMLIYQLDELIIFLTVVFTLRIGRFQEKQGRMLKLFGGTLMCTLAGVLLIRPHLMNDLTASLVVFAAAFVIAALTLFIHRWVSKP